MLSHLWVKNPALPRVREPLSAASRCTVVVCWALLVGRGCLVPPPVAFSEPDPADPYVPVPAVSYRSVVAPYVSLRPAEPGNWQQQNQSVAPQGEAPAHQH
jgi:hypothetical protein